jgi:hypothetical protein
MAVYDVLPKAECMCLTTKSGQTVNRCDKRRFNVAYRVNMRRFNGAYLKFQRYQNTPEREQPAGREYFNGPVAVDV